jgi:pSer/pThr/pTyr-binding forkhead associated (FHA) protein
MQITLKPISHLELDDIVIANGLFHVGRLEQPFCNYPEALVESLSRRHARIFLQDSTPYIADLGSSNGTYINGTPLEDAPLQLQEGDLINLAGDLSYRISIDNGASDNRTRLLESSGIELNLATHNTKIDSIQVLQFPFLISKDSEVFSRYKTSNPEELGFLSRRHAHIYEQGSELYIEDLGSTNGTFLNEKPLDEKAKKITSGDRIGFGGEFFVFKVNILNGDADNDSGNHSKKQPPAQASSSHHTTFISTATSFLDIFCVEEAKFEELEEEKDPEEKVQARKDEEGKSRLSWYGRVQGFVKQLTSILKEDTDRRSHWRYILPSVALPMFLIFVAWFFISGDKRQIESLCTHKEYTACAKKANDYLARHKDEQGIVMSFATEALLKSLVPKWIDEMKNNHYEITGELLKDAQSLSKNHQEGKKILKLLGRISELNEYIHKRGGLEGSINIFKDETTIETLVEQWRTNSNSDRRLMARVVEHVPEFEILRNQVFSELRHLRNDKSLYVSAINGFKTSLRGKIASNDESLLTEIDRFSSRFPRVVGIQPLRDDAKKFLQESEGKNDKDLESRIQIYQNLSFQTNLFQTALEDVKKKALPPSDITKIFSKAQRHWDNGHVKEAVKTLSQVSDEAWLDDAKKIIQRYQGISSEYASLQQAQGTDSYRKQLFRFHASLDPAKDPFFLTTIEDAFIKYRDFFQSRADEWLKSAAEGLVHFRKSGGIQSLQRLEEQVSKHFRAQAMLLSEINRKVIHAQQAYESLMLEMKEDQKSVCKSIAQEMKLQLRALNGLGSILSPKVLETKLRLLSEP